MSQAPTTPCFFHPEQLAFKPVYEWSFGEKIAHPEVTARAENILAALHEADDFEVLQPDSQPLAAIRNVHSYELLTLYNTARQLDDGVTFYPSVFPRELQNMGDPTNIRHAGCYCFDSGTPLNAMTLDAAAWSAACAVAGAERLIDLADCRPENSAGTEPYRPENSAGTEPYRPQDSAGAEPYRPENSAGTPSLVYALSRPPGHHATEKYFGGYSYFNNTVIAAHRLRQLGRVAIVDIDFHHGNGTQSLFYEDPSVLTISLHGDPKDFYPFYCGFSHETGAGAGAGCNLNFCLPAHTDIDAYRAVLEQDVLNAVTNFGADVLIVAAGFDGYELDPIGAFDLRTDDFHTIGELLGELQLPTLVVQEGGYYTPHLGRNVVAFLRGAREGLQRG